MARGNQPDNLKDLQQWLGGDLRLQYEALAGARGQAAQGNTSAAAAIPQLLANLQKTSEAFRGLSDLVGKATDTEKQRERLRQDQLERLTRGMRDATRGAVLFAAGLAAVPLGIAEIVRRSAGGGVNPHNAFSTLRKSVELVLLQLGKDFAPALLGAARAVQDFARDVRQAGGGVGGFGKALEKTGVFGLSGPFGVGRAVETLDALFKFPGAIRERNEAREQAVHGMGPRERALYEHHAGVDRGGLEGFLKLRRFEVHGGIDATALDKTHEDPRRAAALSADLDEARRRRQEGPADGGPYLKAWNQALTRLGAGYTDLTDRARAAGVTLPGSPGQGGDGFKHDLKPPGYSAQYQGVEEARRSLQLAALNQTPLEAEILREGLRVWKEQLAITKRMEAHAGGPALPPPRAGR